PPPTAVMPATGPELPAQAPTPSGPTSDHPPVTTPTASVAELPTADPTATHPAASRPGPVRPEPTSWSADPVPGSEDAPDHRPRRQALRPSSNGEGPHPEGR